MRFAAKHPVHAVRGARATVALRSRYQRLRHGFANGQLPLSDLVPLSGNPGRLLRRDAAAGFNAMFRDRAVYVSDAYRPLGRPGDLSRGIWSQWAAWERYKAGGNLAAFPGTSNHGWGLAIDLASYSYRNVIDAIGAHFGWSKSWSDAQSEWWHILYQPGHFNPPSPPPSRPTDAFPLKVGSLGPRVRMVQKALIARGHKDLKADGIYGNATANAVKVFVFDNAPHLRVDGKVYKSVWERLFPTLSQHGDKWPGATYALQHELRRRSYKVAHDGVYGSGMAKAVTEFQKRNGLHADGIVGDATWHKLFG